MSKMWYGMPHKKANVAMDLFYSLCDSGLSDFKPRALSTQRRLT